MNIRNNIVKARSHIAFCIGLILAASFALSMETGIARSLGGNGTRLIVKSIDQTNLARATNLTDQDMKYARAAWNYFEANYQPDTGLVNSANNFPSTTIWDQASYLLGLISAQRIGLIDQDVFDQRMSQNLQSLAKLPLFDGRLPNKVYDTRTLTMANYDNTPNARGIGWSALDVARITVPLNVLLYDYPQHAGAAGQILSNWDFSAMLNNGTMFGARVDENGLTERVQEGRLGYEEYGARAINLLGLDAMTAVKYDDYLDYATVSGQKIAIDSRSYSEFNAHNYVVSEPYILTAIEFGFDAESQELAHRIYRAQNERFKRSGILTAVSEDNIDQEPYFLYNTVYANGTPWNALAEDGTQHPDKRTVSTKAAFGWDALYATDYTARLMKHVAQTQTEKMGFASGVYESDGRINNVTTANTNAIILETLQYKANGPLLTARFKRKES
tara:strand:- start:1003 stop:2340 length:1338 start_codon:yes stop_codon:yes gene_type:complete